MSHIPTIQAIYAAFSSGDAQTFLEKMSEDVRWEHWQNNLAQQGGVTYLQPRRGKAGAADFLASLAAIELKELALLDMMESKHQVAVTFTIEFVVKATGKTVRDDEVHLWTFDDSGRVIALRHYVDTAKHLAAARPD
jgi:ketosteroid isomerase-like protein